MAISSPDVQGGGRSSALVDLFSKSAHKPSPGYDYSVVPSRLVEDRDSEEEDDKKKIKKKKKPKSGLRGLRKKAEAEAAAAASGELLSHICIRQPTWGVNFLARMKHLDALNASPKVPVISDILF